MNCPDSSWEMQEAGRCRPTLLPLIKTRRRSPDPGSVGISLNDTGLGFVICKVTPHRAPDSYFALFKAGGAEAVEAVEAYPPPQLS